MVPISRLSKLLTIVYAVVGIPLTLYVLSALGGLLVKVIWTIYARLTIFMQVR